MTYNGLMMIKKLRHLDRMRVRCYRVSYGQTRVLCPSAFLMAAPVSYGQNAFPISNPVCILWQNSFPMAKRVSYGQVRFLRPNSFPMAKRISYDQARFLWPFRQMYRPWNFQCNFTCLQHVALWHLCLNYFNTSSRYVHSDYLMKVFFFE